MNDDELFSRNDWPVKCSKPYHSYHHKSSTPHCTKPKFGLSRMKLYTVVLIPKSKVVLLLEIGGVKLFYHSSVLIVECVSKYIFSIKQNQKRKQED